MEGYIENESISDYLARFDNFVELNNVATNDRAKWLLAYASPHFFNIIKTVCLPQVPSYLNLYDWTVRSNTMKADKASFHEAAGGNQQEQIGAFGTKRVYQVQHTDHTGEDINTFQIETGKQSSILFT